MCSSQEENKSIPSHKPETNPLTDMWHKRVSETINFEVCLMYEATHVLFSENDIALAGEDANGLSKNKLYPIHIYEDTGDIYIVDDNNEARIGFDLFIPCEYFKEVERVSDSSSNNVVSLSQYKEWKRLNG